MLLCIFILGLKVRCQTHVGLLIDIANMVTIPEMAASSVEYGDTSDYISIMAVRAMENYTSDLNGYGKLSIFIMNATTEPAVGSFLNASLNDLAAMYMTYKVGAAIHVYYLPVIIILGFIGNTLSLLVTLQNHNRQVSFCVYMSALALVDNVIILSILYIYISATNDLKWTTPTKCRVNIWIFHSLGGISICLVVLMTLDRFLAVCHPYKAPSMRTPRQARVNVFVLFVTMIIIHVPYYFYSTLEKGTCQAFGRRNIFSRIFSTVFIICLCLVPFTLILTMNSLILNAVRKRNQYLKKVSMHQHTLLGDKSVCVDTLQEKCGQSQNAPQSRSSHRQNHLTAILPLVSFTLLVLNLPQFVRYVVYLFINNRSDPSTYANFLFLYNLTQKIYFTNFACNFYLYCLGSRKFRFDCFRIFKCGINIHTEEMSMK